MTALSPEALAELDAFHATPIATVLANRPPRWEPWESVAERYREAFGACRTPNRQRARLAMIANAARRARHG